MEAIYYFCVCILPHIALWTVRIEQRANSGVQNTLNSIRRTCKRRTYAHMWNFHGCICFVWQYLPELLSKRNENMEWHFVLIQPLESHVCVCMRWGAGARVDHQRNTNQPHFITALWKHITCTRGYKTACMDQCLYIYLDVYNTRVYSHCVAQRNQFSLIKITTYPFYFISWSAFITIFISASIRCNVYISCFVGFYFYYAFTLLYCCCRWRRHRHFRRRFFFLFLLFVRTFL